MITALKRLVSSLVLFLHENMVIQQILSHFAQIFLAENRIL